MSDLFKLSERLGTQLQARGMWLAVAESCTGGWVAKCLTDVPGSSRWFERGFVTYSNAAKQEMLGVPAATLQQHGAVSEPTVAAMAAGVLGHSPADLALAISGIAGPGGAVPGKPVGTVCFAWATRRGATRIETRLFAGGREQVRRAAVIHGITRLIELSADA
ncbi:MAG: CinA family protein [Pseudomonadota bacterium]